MSDAHQNPTIIYGSGSNVAHVYGKRHSWLEFRISDGKKFVPVARVYCHEGEAEKEFCRKAVGIFKETFSGRLNEKRYLDGLNKGELTPKSLWEEIKKEYQLPGDYDVNE